MSDIAELYNYQPQSVKIKNVYTCTLNPEGPIVGFEIEVPDRSRSLLVRVNELKTFIKEKGNLHNVELFKSDNKDGLVISPCSIRSLSRNFSFSKGDHVININHLQKLTWEGEIDYTNMVQVTFTSLC